MIVIGSFFLVGIVVFVSLKLCFKPSNPLEQKQNNGESQHQEIVLTKMPMTPPPVFNPPAPVVKKAEPETVNGISKTVEKSP
mmetsp:Transcript_2662/g.4150  ORF Transcript_2662/g.4150 Transcript_2662/m.4150 type:complete len:82 (-) Transcript_2662:306-551(-)